MKILFLISSLRGGGAERVGSTLCNYWSAVGNSVTLVTLDNSENDFYQVDANITRYSLDSYRNSKNIFDKVRINVARVRNLRKIVQKNKPDIVVAFMPLSNILAILACLGTRVPVVISERVYPAYFHDRDLFDRCRKFIYKFSQAFVAQTRQIADWAHGFFNKPIATIANPLSERAFYKGAAIPRENIILAMGRLQADKGFDMLLAAFKLCHTEFPDWQLHIAGKGSDQAQLQATIVNYGLSDQVKLLGQTDAPDQLFAKAKIFALSSRVEGFPNVLLEAMANGLAVTSFACASGPAELIRDSENGLLVPAGQVAALANSLKKLMRDEALRQQLGMEAMKVREKYQVEAIAQQWLNLFWKLLLEI